MMTPEEFVKQWHVFIEDEENATTMIRDYLRHLRDEINRRADERIDEITADARFHFLDFGKEEIRLRARERAIRQIFDEIGLDK